MTPNVDASSSTEPVRAWYLARQSFGAIPITEWGKPSSIESDYPASLIEGGLRPILTGGHTEPLIWWTERATEASSSRAGGSVTEILAVVDESDRNAQTVSAPSVAQNRLTERIEESLGRLYELAQDEWFEDGMQSNLSVGIEVLLRRYPAETISVLSKLLQRSQPREAALVETLKVLGRVESPETRGPRLFLLLGFLSHPSVIVRDATLVALCLLNDERAVSHLEKMATLEDDVFFKQDLKEVVAQIRG